MKFGLGFKFISVIVILVILFAGFILLFFIPEQRNALTNELMERGKILSQNLATNSTWGILTGDKIILSELIRDIPNQKDLGYVEIMNKRGDILSSYYPRVNPIALIEREKLHLDEPDIIYTVSMEGDAIYEYFYPVWVPVVEESESDWFMERETEDGATAETEIKSDKIGFVRLGISVESTFLNISRLQNYSILTFGIICALMVIVLSLFLNQIVIKPIRLFTQRAEDITAGNLDNKIIIDSNDEFGRLATSFNKMTKRLKKDIDIIKATEDKLREYSEELEDKVEERTKELEEMNKALLNAIEEVKQADSMKSMFLANMSHELRTPLNSIIGFTGMILMGMTGEVTSEQKKQLTMVKNSASHLLSLINDILDISKIEAGKIDIFPEKFKLKRIIQETTETVIPAIKDKGLELRDETEKGIEMVSDVKRIRQIILNLLSNAVKFTDRGSIRIKSDILENEYLELQIVDTGMGIDEADMDKLFKSFQQIDMSSTKTHEGTGLGLYLSKKLVTLLGGKISAKSELGKGSEFAFTIPLVYKEK